MSNGLRDKDLILLNSFIEQYPTWWWRLGWCDLSRDFTCAPQGHSPEAIYIKSGNEWDNGFSCDSYGSFADSIAEVMNHILHTKNNPGF